jgi:hypothetical protein
MAAISEDGAVELGELAGRLLAGFPYVSREDGVVHRVGAVGRVVAEVCTYPTGHTRLNLVPRLHASAERLGISLEGDDRRFPGQGVVVTDSNVEASRQLIAEALRADKSTASDASSPAWTLRPGETIKRTALHEAFGGSGYGGMAPSTTSPNVFLFTDPKIGHDYGYFDGWVGDVFHYTGHGQRGDQRFAHANRATRDYISEGRALRLFRGVGGTVTYLGRFDLDPDEPYYRTDAPERGSDAIRQVIVFRLRPRGEVLHAPDDELELPEGFSAQQLEEAVTETRPSVAEVPIEAQHTEQVIVNPSHEPHTAERREQALVLSYEQHLVARGSEVTRHRIQPPGEGKPLLTDLYDKTRNNLIEAKGTGVRGEIRMAIGQLADYSRFISPRPNLAVLLPDRPRRDLEELLASQGISAIWQEGGAFIDNAEGCFV